MNEKKIRLAIFGITDEIWKVIKENLNFWNVDIVVFIDSDKNKHGIEVNGIPIVGIDDFDYKKVDYIIVTALSAYDIVKKSLLDKGVCEDDIMPFITNQLCEFCVGSLEKYKREIYDVLYNEAEKFYLLAQKYEKTYTEYVKQKPFEHSGQEWYFKSHLISHACGGKINNHEYMYTNSKESFKYSLEKGFKLIECDVMKLNGELVLAHDFTKLYESTLNRFSMQTFGDILLQVKCHPEVSLLVDVKWKDIEEYCDVLECIERDIKSIEIKEESTIQTIKSQIILEVYNEETIEEAKKRGFECFFTQYRNPSMKEFMNTVNICFKYGVKVVGLGVELALIYKKLLHLFTDKKISIFSFSTDSIDDFSILRKSGVTGVFTNYLTEVKK